MRRKGFTIIEIIISLVILISISLVVGVSLNKVFKNTEEAGADSFKDQIISSTDLYLANNQPLTNELQTTKGYLLIPIGDLIEAGLLDGNAIDPETGEKVSSDNIVKVSLDANGLLKIEYNVDSPSESYLEAQTLNLEYNETFNCQDINSYTDEWGTQSLRLIDATGNVISTSINDVITKIDCTIDTSKPGSSQIVYTYKIPDNEVLKSLSRTTIVSSSSSDIITLNAVVEPKTVIINNNLTFTVTGTDRVGNQHILSADEYTIDEQSTSAVGTFSPKITYSKDNSDGSKPTATVTYTVIDSISAIIDLDSNCIKQSDGSCWYIGNQSGNYLTYLGQTWRIFRKNANNSMSIILNYATGQDFSFSYKTEVEDCGIGRCCNAGFYQVHDSREVNYFLLSQDPNGLLTYLNNYINALSGNKSYLIDSTFDLSSYLSGSLSYTGSMTNRVGLLSYKEYMKIASCSGLNCGSSYLKIPKNWGLITPYGTNDGTMYVTSQGGVDKAFSTIQSIRYIRGILAWSFISNAGTILGVRPVIVLNGNVKIQGGNGTVTNPYIAN